MQHQSTLSTYTQKDPEKGNYQQRKSQQKIDFFFQYMYTKGGVEGDWFSKCGKISKIVIVT